MKAAAIFPRIWKTRLEYFLMMIEEAQYPGKTFVPGIAMQFFLHKPITAQ